MKFDFDFAKWWHETIDHLFKHPHADVVAHPAIAAIAAAMPVPAAAPAPAAPVGAAPPAPPAPKLDADGKELVTFDPAAHPDPAERVTAVQALRVATQTRRGDFLFRIVSPNGLDVSVQGDEINPTGTRDESLTFSSFDGHGPTVDFKAGVPVAVSVTGVPAAQGFNIGWYEATVPCEMDVVATRGGQEIARAGAGTGHGNGNGGILAVPGGEGDVSVAVTAPVDTQRAVAIKP